MKKTIGIFIVLIMVFITNSSSLYAQPTTHKTQNVPKADSVKVKNMTDAHYSAFSSPKNAKTSNGEAHSDNIPKLIVGQFPAKGLYLYLDTVQLNIISWPSFYEKPFLAHDLYFVNHRDSAVEINAQDSRLKIIAEVLNKEGKWVPIEYFASSTCGNSYHTITLDKMEYWKFSVPVFEGPYKTKLRYTFHGSKRALITSNETVVYIHPDQMDPFTVKGYKPKNLMDPNRK